MVHTVVPLTASEEVTSYPNEAVALLEALSPEERRDVVSRKDSPLNMGEMELPSS